MNVHDTPEMAAHRAMIREWIEKEVPAACKNRPQGNVMASKLTREEMQPLWDAMDKRGWLAPAWPKEHGGQGWDTIQMVIFDEEYTRAGLPLYRNNAGISNLGPIIIKWGTAEQKQKFLGPSRTRKILWCQGYSEPNAGSDLASLRLKAEATEGGWLLNGQKIWTSRAHFAEWMFLLARTNSNTKRKQEGISFLLLDMKTPGIRIRPLVTIDDHHHFNETFFENVFVPKENLVGELDKGWTVAKALLDYERFNSIMGNPIVLGRAIDQVKQAARESAQNGGVVWDDLDLRRQVVGMEMDTDCIKYTRYRALSKIARGDKPGPEVFLFKFYGTVLFWRILEAHQQVLGTAGIAWNDEPLGALMGEVARHNCTIRASGLRGGTNEVQKNVVAKRILGLPD